METADSGRERKYYRLTPKGTKKLKADTAQWRRLAAAMASLGILHPAPAGGAA